MSLFSREELKRSVTAGRLEPLYLLFGAETYLRDSAVRLITDTALTDTPLREFNESAFSLLTRSVHEALAAAEQLPLMAKKRVVGITDFAKLREADEEALIKYLNNPVPSTVAIFVAGEPDKRKKLTKALFDNCIVVEFAAIKDGDAKAWVRSRLKELKLDADLRAIDEIVSLVGTDVQTLHSELDKLSAAAISTGRITVELVDELIGRSRELSNFTLGDQLLARNRKRALETLHRLLDGGAEPVMLLGLIAGNYHRLAIGRDLIDRGARNEIFKYVNVSFYSRDAFMAAVQRSDRDRIARGIKLIAAADLAIKSSRATPRLQLELLVCELAS